MEIQKKALLSTAVFLSTFAISNLATAATTTIVSYTPWQIISNNNSAKPSLSKGSTAIAFESDATNLVPYSTSTPWGDGNSARDIFLRVGGRTFVRLSVNSLGQEAENSAFSWYNQPGGGSAQNARSSNVSLC